MNSGNLSATTTSAGPKSSKPLTSNSTDMNDTPQPLTSLAGIRREFPGTDKWIYFETSARGLMPAGARDAVMRYLDDRILEGGAPATMLDRLESVRAKFAQMIGAEADEVAIVKNVSEGINAIVTSLKWQR